MASRTRRTCDSGTFALSGAACQLLLCAGPRGVPSRGPFFYRMFVFISHLTVLERDRAALERHFRERSHLVDGFPGFLYLQLLAPQGGSASHAFLTAWESRRAFSEYMRSEEHRLSHSREPAEIMAR